MTYKTPLILAALVATFLGHRQLTSGKVLSQTAEVTPTAVPSPTPSPTLTPTPTFTPRPPRVPTPLPQPQFTPEQIYSFTQKYGGQYGVDSNVIRHIALCESTFDPLARNYIYAGLFQFDARTWKVYRQKMGEDPHPDLRYHAEEAVQTAAFALSLGQGRIWPNCQP